VGLARGAPTRSQNGPEPTDIFLEEQLRPELFEEACAEAGQPLTPRRHECYDDGYYFVSTFMQEHLEHHVDTLGIRG